MRKISHMQNEEPFLEHILSSIRFNFALKNIKKDFIVGDIGCGYNGNLLLKLSKLIKLGVGYDISVSKKLLPDNIVLKATDINKKIDSKKNYFDAVCALAVLEHVEKPSNFLKRINAILKTNGILVLTTPHKFGKPFLELLSNFRLISKDEIDDHKNYFDIESLKNILKLNGYKIVKIGVFGILWLNLFCIAKKVNLPS